MARGHIRARGKGTWAIVLELPRDASGKRKQRWHSVKGTKREAERRLAQLLHQLDTGQYMEPSRLTLAAYFDQWVQNDLKNRVSISTRERYESDIRLHLVPLLGNTCLTRLTPLQIQDCYTQLLENGSSRGGGLTSHSLHTVHSVLHQALRQAVRWRLLTQNPADAVQVPTGRPSATHPFAAGELTQLLDASRGHWLHLAILLAISTGMRRGEILGLRWADLDLDQHHLSLQQAVVSTKQSVRLAPPKTPGSRRALDLPSLAVEALRRYQADQAARRRHLGALYQDHDLVLCRVDGRPMTPSVLTRAFRDLVKKLGLKGRFHDLRHTHATMFLEQGTHPKIVSERLGHSKVGITLDRYSHVLPHLQKEAVEQFDVTLRKALGG